MDVHMKLVTHTLTYTFPHNQKQKQSSRQKWAKEKKKERKIEEMFCPTGESGRNEFKQSIVDVPSLSGMRTSPGCRPSPLKGVRSKTSGTWTLASTLTCKIIGKKSQGGDKR